MRRIHVTNLTLRRRVMALLELQLFHTIHLSNYDLINLTSHSLLEYVNKLSIYGWPKHMALNSTGLLCVL